MQKMLKSYTHLQNSAELRAYLYQNINELEPHLMANSTLTFSFKKLSDSARKNPGAYRVKFMIALSDMQIEAKSIDADPFDAIRFAKLAMLEHLFNIEEQVESVVGQQRTTKPQKAPLN